MRSVSVCTVGFALAALFAAMVHADEVDDLLALKAKPMERVKRFSAEVVMETALPGGKTATSRQRITMERGAGKDGREWRLEVESFEPMPMKLRKDGERIELQGKDGQWKELPSNPQMREQLAGLSRQFGGNDPAAIRKQFAMRIVRRNRSWFGSKTTTIEMVPQGQGLPFGRIEEDVAEDGLALATRLYDTRGVESVQMRVAKQTTIKGLPIAEATDIFTVSGNGSNKATMLMRGVEVETQ